VGNNGKGTAAGDFVVESSHGGCQKCGKAAIIPLPQCNTPDLSYW
jgi:hypothetical protein